MLNKYPLWKYLMVLVVLALGLIYAAPNLYPDQPAIQISGASTSVAVDSRTLSQVEKTLAEEGVGYVDGSLIDTGALIRFSDNESQLKAKTIISAMLGEDYLVALNLAPTTPDWLVDLGAGPMKLGLDLRGGVHFLMEVDMAKAISQRIEVYDSEIKSLLREERLRYRDVEVTDDGKIDILFTEADVRSEALSLLKDNYSDFQFDTREEDGNFYIELGLLESKIQEIEDYAVQQNLTTLRNRVNELGVSEPLVQRQGRDRIVVELPGIQDAALAKKIIGATANLEFRLEAQPDELRSRTETFNFRSAAQSSQEARVEKSVIITGSNVSSASTGYDENGLPQVNISLDGQGGKLMNRATRSAIGRKMAVLFIEYKTRSRYEMVDGVRQEVRENYVEKAIISLATIQSALGNSFRITGLDSPQEASELALLLRAGSLAAPIYFVEERTVGPSLGQENIDLGIFSVKIGLALVLVFMLAVYRLFGLFANIALGFNLVLLVAVMSIISATLTMPGIAGIVLTVGMAVDANVLIFARIREELKNGMPPQSAINAGYERAFQTIFDANLTTLLVAVILFAVGTGPVQGFAVTLSIGILTSMFTAIVCTRALVNLTHGGRRNLKKLWI